MSEPKTFGIPPANQGPLQVLQFHEGPWSFEVGVAADEISRYHGPNEGQATRHKALSFALKSFLSEIVTSAPPGPERSTAISRAREAKMWASAAIALEPGVESAFIAPRITTGATSLEAEVKAPTGPQEAMERSLPRDLLSEDEFDCPF